MKEIPRTKKVEVAQHYLTGSSYRDIENETGVSHGSIVNIVKELEDGGLTISGSPFDQVNDLRQLAIDLKKTGQQPSQALLGLSLYSRLQSLGITPEHLDSWTEMLKRFATPDSNPGDFFLAALRLHELETDQSKPNSSQCQ
jgi:hypothetical protein